MGAGDFDAGLGLAGEDPLPALTPPRNVQPPVALWFDGASADFLLDTGTGLYVPLHPVDQAVALALCIREGTLGSAPEVGNQLRTIRKLGPTTAATADTMVRNALSNLVQNKDIDLRKVEVQTRTPQGALLVAVTYHNLRRDAQQPRTVMVNVSSQH